MRNQVVLLLVAVLLLGSCSDGAGRAEKADGEADASSDVAADVAQPDGTEVSDDVQTDLADQNDLTADTDGIEVDGQDTSDVTELVDFQTSVDVSTSTGELLGVESGGLRVFKGIPYAEPPVGDGRFRAPRGKAAWDGVLDASDFGASCLQGYATFNETSEDCLTLNVWAHTDTTPRPIMVWLYGGGFVLGESATPLYDGADLAVGADVVVVSLNYRLGLFGSLALPELQAEDARGAAGNMGLLDQIEALRHAIEASQDRIASLESQGYPTVFVGASYTNKTQQNSTNVYPQVVSGFVGMNWNPDLEGSRSAKVAQAQAERQRLEATLRDAEEQVALAALSYRLDFEAATAQEKAAATTVRSAEENLRVVSERFSQGLATSTDVVEAQSLLAKARADQAQAHFDKAEARARWARMVGQLLPDPVQ